MTREPTRQQKAGQTQIVAAEAQRMAVTSAIRRAWTNMMLELRLRGHDGLGKPAKQAAAENIATATSRHFKVQISANDVLGIVADMNE